MNADEFYNQFAPGPDPQAPMQMAPPPQKPTLGQRMAGGLGRLQAGLFPMDPTAAQSMPPEHLQALRHNAMMKMGLGMMAAGSQSGATLGSSMAQGYMGASNDLQGSLQSGYRNAMAKKQDDRQTEAMASEMENRKLDNARADAALAAQQEQRAADLEERKANNAARLEELRLNREALTAYREGKTKKDSDPDKPPSGYRFKADGSGLEFIPGGPADPKSKNEHLRPIPPAVAQGIASNRQEMAKIDRALTALDDNPDAFGMKNYMPDAVIQRTDPKGVDARAKVGDIGSLIIHDRSGAAVSASEFPRLRPFIPQATDDPATVKVKLNNLRANIAAMQEETESLFTPETGYKPMDGALPKSTAPSKGQSFKHSSGATVEIIE